MELKVNDKTIEKYFSIPSAGKELVVAGAQPGELDSFSIKASTQVPTKMSSSSIRTIDNQNFGLKKGGKFAKFFKEIGIILRYGFNISDRTKGKLYEAENDMKQQMRELQALKAKASGHLCSIRANIDYLTVAMQQKIDTAKELFEQRGKNKNDPDVRNLLGEALFKKKEITNYMSEMEDAKEAYEKISFTAHAIHRAFSNRIYEIRSTIRRSEMAENQALAAKILKDCDSMEGRYDKDLAVLQAKSQEDSLKLDVAMESSKTLNEYKRFEIEELEEVEELLDQIMMK